MIFTEGVKDKFAFYLWRPIAISVLYQRLYSGVKLHMQLQIFSLQWVHYNFAGCPRYLRVRERTQMKELSSKMK